MIHLESQHVIAFPREAVWPVLSNTDWLNRSVGLPPVEYDVKPRPEGGSSIRARARVFGQEMRWEELPFEWVEPEFYRVHRIFETGPFTEGKMGMELHAEAGERTRVVVFSDLAPRNTMGKWIARRWLGPKTRRDMERITAHAEQFLRGRAAVPMPSLPVEPANEAALQAGLKMLREAGQPTELIGLLENFLRTAPDVELGHIRPLVVARKWGRDPWEVLGMFLLGPRCGLLDMRWEILCPNCRGTPQEPASSLRRLSRKTHCPGCQIEFDAEFDKSVELKFAINPAIRRPDGKVFCLAGPGGRPHVLSQLWLQPAEERTWKLPLLTGLCRLRSPQVEAALNFPPEDLGNVGCRVVCQPERFAVSQAKNGSNGAAQVSNPNPFAVLICLEQIAWSEDILTAARVTNWQQFRDLFSNEVISPTEQVTVGSQVVLFTDLRGSTAMYSGLGDAPAYVLVRNHFAVLAEAVRANHGTVVKTIGDAVMASFSRVDEALHAVREMHEKLPSVRSSNGGPLSLKSSLHVGPCLAVNANDRLDFFGSTINLAARMVGCCQGGDLTVSDDLFQRSETAEFLKGCPQKPQPAEVQFRGFSTPHKVWRIQMVA